MASDGPVMAPSWPRVLASLLVGALFLCCGWGPQPAFSDGSAATATATDLGGKQTSETLRLEGDARLSAGDYTAAVKLYTQALNSIGSAPTTTSPISEDGVDGARMRLLFKRAEVHFLQHNYKLALLDLQQLDSTDALLLRARVHQKLGDLNKSLNEYEQILKKSPSNKEAQQQALSLRSATASLKMAQQAMDKKAWPLCVDALGALLSSTAASKDNVKFRLMRAECAYEARNQAEMRNELNRIFAVDSENVDALHLLAKSLYRLGAINETLSYLKKCTRYDPDNRKCREFNKLVKKSEKLWGRAEDTFRNHKFADAIREYQTYLDEVPEPFNKDTVLARLCHCFVEVRQADDAIRVCSQLTDSADNLVPSETLSDAFVDRAEAFILKDDLDSAARDASRAGELNQNSGKVNDLHNKIQRLRKMASRKDLYKILGVPKTASERDIKKAYRRMATIYHPDRYGMSEETKKMTKEAAEKQFKDLVEAHEVLTDSDKRRRYDLGEDLNEGPGAQPHYQPFHSFFHGPGGGQTFTFRFG